MKNVDVIIPVYRGLDETIECIISAANSLPTWANLVVINDCSPEKALTDWLVNNALKYNFELYHNANNLGFVATVNYAMSLHLERDVLLLNSDVEVANSDWLHRIRENAYSRNNIGSVTPFSNNATICSFPNFCQDNELFQGLSVDEIDAHFKKLKLAHYDVEIPTGVGFCMYLRRDCLNDVGLFDVDTFGKGYGEENDWCQRAIKQGWVNTHALNVFAYHKGGVSFASEQDHRKEKALELLLVKHPQYTRDVMRFIADDPAKYARVLALISIIADSGKKVAAVVSHARGGGVQQHIEELANYYAESLVILLLRPIDEQRVELSFWSGTQFVDVLQFDVELQWLSLLEILKSAGVGRVHYHHFIGVHSRLLQLHTSLSCSYDISIHDFYLINGNPSLTNKDGKFCDDMANLDALCAEQYPIPMSGTEWRNHYQPLLQHAERVIFPSHDTYDIFSQFYALTNNVIVTWHLDSESYCFKDNELKESELKESELKENAESLNNSPLKVLCLGALGLEKGGQVLEDVAQALSGEKITFTLLGYAFKKLKGVETYGAYDNADIDSLIHEIQPDIIWFPAQWPETYCYTLSAALRYPAPIIAPNIGAFPERLAACQRGVITDWNKTIPEWTAFWQSILCHETALMSGLKPASIKPRYFYRDDYLNVTFSSFDLDDNFLCNIETLSLEHHVAIGGIAPPPQADYFHVIGVKQSFHQLLVSLRHHRYLSSIGDVIPLSLKHKIKNRLS